MTCPYSFADRLQVSYAGDAERKLIARVIHDWQRGEIAGPVMSASSGPKAYLQNLVFTLFETGRDIERILWLIGEYKQSIPFCLYLRAGCWYDCTAKLVEIADAPTS